MTKRRTWGTIKSVSRDKHVIRYTAEGSRKSETFHGSRREAEARLAKLRILHEGKSRRRCPTVGQAAEAWWVPWLESSDASTNTRKVYSRAWEKIAAPRWGDVRLDRVKVSEVQEWLDGLAKGNAHHAIVVLRKIGDLALKHDAVEINPFAHAYELPKASSARSKAVLTLAEADALFARLRGSVLEAPFIAACFGSCRTGESLALKPDDVERVERGGLTFAVARVERQMGQQGFEPTDILKTDTSRRVVIVPPPWGARLIEIAEERRASGSEWLADRGDGLPLNGNALQRLWVKSVDDGARVPFSNLRNSWRTFAQAEWGIDYDLLEVLMGHRLQGVTGRHYLRFTETQIIDRFAVMYASGCAS